MKKIIAIATTLAVAVMLAPASIGAATTAELQAQIDLLMAQIATLQGQLVALGGGGVTGCTITSFARNLSQGATGDDVKCLQIILNSAADTKVAASGVGSSGSETTYFGPLTQAAVVKFQDKYASTILTPLGLTSGTGFVGNATRTKLNSMLAAGEEEEEEEEEEEGAEIGEGELTFKLLGIPSGVDVKEGQSNVAVSAFELKAKDSDITVKRIDLISDYKPGKDLSYVSLYDGANALAGVNATEFTKISGSTDYKYRFDGLNLKIAKGTTKTVTVKVSALASVTGLTYTFEIPATEGIRYIDTLGLTHYLAGTALKLFDTVAADTGQLKVTLNADSPKEGIVIVSDTADTEDVELLRFDIQAKKLAVTIDTIQIDLATDATTATVDEIISGVYLYSGTTLIGGPVSVTKPGDPVECEAVDYCAIFDDLELDVAKDAKKTFSVKGDIVEFDEESGYEEGASISATLAEGVTTEERIVAADENDEDLTYIEITGSAAGEAQYLYLVVPVISNISATITETKEFDKNTTDWMDGTITFRLTAQGDDIVISAIAARVFNVDDDTELAAADSIASSLVTINGKSLALATTPEKTITEGAYKTIQVKVRVNDVTDGVIENGEYVYVFVKTITWTAGSITGTLVEDLVTDPLLWVE